MVRFGVYETSAAAELQFDYKCCRQDAPRPEFLIHLLSTNIKTLNYVTDWIHKNLSPKICSRRRDCAQLCTPDFLLRIMPGTSPVILILGAGPNIGQTVAKTFASKGFKVALAARSLREADSTENQLNITSDFANPDDVVNAFIKVKQVLGIPSVVVYNGKP